MAQAESGQITVDGISLHLYNTHFPSNDEGRKKYGADQIAARIPVNYPTGLGGDFNDGPSGEAMAAIDAKFVTAESIATLNADRPCVRVPGSVVVCR